MILSVDPLLEPANGPTLFPFDPGILYEINVDNNQDAIEDVIFQFRFKTEYQLPNVFTAVAGVDGGAFKPRNEHPRRAAAASPRSTTRASTSGRPTK